MKKTATRISIISLCIVSFVIFSNIIINNYESSLHKKPKSEYFNERFPDAKERKLFTISLENLTNFRINTIDGVSEPSFAVNPQNSNLMVIGANDFRLSGNKATLFYSEDRGGNWTKVTVNMSDNLSYNESTDPSVAFDNSGVLYYAMINYQTHGNGDGLFVNRSFDAGKSWMSKATLVKGNSSAIVFEDRPTITVDRSNSSYANNVYVVWTSIQNNHNKILFARSTNQAETFEQITEIAAGQVQSANITVGNDGAIYITYVKNNNQIYIVKSIDGGSGFSSASLVTEFIHSGDLVNNRYLLKQNNGIGVRVKTHPGLTVDNISGNIYIVYSAANGNDKSDIFLTYSNSPSGISNNYSWIQPIRVNNDNTLSDQAFPEIKAVNGQIAVSWLDSRNDAMNKQFESYIGFTTAQNIETFENRKISTSGFNPFDILINNYVGDYIGLDISNGEVVTVWTDGREGLFDLYGGVYMFNPANIDNENLILNDFVLSQNYPNPFNPSTRISFSIPSEGRVSLKLYDINGRELKEILNKNMTAGTHFVDINMVSLKLNLSSGIYIYELQHVSKKLSKKMNFIK